MLDDAAFAALLGLSTRPAPPTAKLPATPHPPRRYPPHLTCRLTHHVRPVLPIFDNAYMPSPDPGRRGARFITCLREPHDAARSFYRHVRGMYSDQLCGGDTSTFDAHFSMDDFAATDFYGKCERGR